MHENYADALESYLIPEPAEEGFIGATFKVLGITIASIIALPFVVIGGISFVYGANVAKEARKLRKSIKKNKSEYVDYGGASWRILKEYEKNIIGVQEPKEFNKLIPVYQKMVEIAKVADVIRMEFIKLDPTNSSNNSKYQIIINKINKLIDQIESYKNIDVAKINKSDAIQNKLESSSLMKICELERERSKILFKDTSDCEFIIPYYAYSDSKGDELRAKIEKNDLAWDCLCLFDEISNAFDRLPDSYKLMELCKFAVDHKARPKK